MGKVVEKKKKKGRPSLLDLQKRSLKLQQQQQQEQQQDSHLNHPEERNPNPNPHRTAPITSTPTPTPTRRSTRRNPNLDVEEGRDADDDAAEDEDEEESTGGRREKKLKFVLRLPSQRNSPSLNSGSHASDSNAEDENGVTNHNKRKINAVGGGSGYGISEKGEKAVSCTNSRSNQQGTQLDSGPSTPLPDTKLLIFILDRLQKKDTYGVFSDPVDPNELPDYHDIIEHPMDFATVRQKLNSGAYANLEQFEKDVFLICSNAMQYNSPDTIYFRQARSIQELARKNFENLRQDSDNSEPEPKIVRRGRPPTKNLKKPLGRPPLERAGTEIPSDATPASGGEGSVRSHYDLRKGPVSEKNSSADLSERLFHGSRKSEAYASWLAEQKSERNEEFTGSLLKGHPIKHGKKQFVLDENRRNTYKQFHQSAGVCEPSVLSTFDGEKKQLMAVGLLTEFGYARSLSRFAATLGPVAWKIASNKIERSLPAGEKFGPGWVGESEAAPRRMLPLSPPTSSQLSPFPTLPLPGNSFSAATPSTVELKGNESSEKTEVNNLFETRLPSTVPALEGHSSKLLSSSNSIPSTSIAADRYSELSPESEEAVRGSISNTRFNNMEASVGPIRFQIQQNSVIRPGMNGFNGTYGVNIPAQMGKLVREMHPTGLNLQSSRIPDMISRNNSNYPHPLVAKNSNLQEPKFSENSSRINANTRLQTLGTEGLEAEKAGHHPQPSWQGSSPQQQLNSVPPDLNVMYHSQQRSPSTSSTQPDLALQL